jgi:Rubisco LSMT substrate-binding
MSQRYAASQCIASHTAVLYLSANARMLLRATANCYHTSFKQKQISDANEKAAWSLVAAVITAELAAQNTSVSQDQAILSGVGKSFSEEKQLAIRFRIEKQRVLSAANKALTAASIA